MATTTYEVIQSVTLASSASGIVFSSIPDTFRDLRIVFDGTTDGGIRVQLNNDAGGNYQTTAFGASGSGTSQANEAAGFAQPSYWANFNTRGILILDFFDYAQTDKHTSFLARGNGSWVVASINRWANTAKVNNISVQDSNASMGAGSTMTLFGIAG